MLFLALNYQLHKQNQRTLMASSKFPSKGVSRGTLSMKVISQKRTNLYHSRGLTADILSIERFRSIE